MKKTRIIVADDHAVVRMGFVSLLESEKDIEVVGEAGDGAAAVALARRTRPDVMLMDLVMPKQDGIAATAAVKQILPQTKVFILTTFTDADGIRRALDAGADGAMLKSSDYSEVIAAIRRVVAGERVLAPEVRKMLENDVPPPDLTPRQLDVLTLMTRGLTNADIAAQLGISPDGVKFHITSILAKLGAANRAEAIAIALRGKLLHIRTFKTC